MVKWKTVFRKVRGRIIPIRVDATRRMQDDFVNIFEVQSARRAIKVPGADELAGAFLKTARKRAKLTGQNVAKRIASIQRLTGKVKNGK